MTLAWIARDGRSYRNIDLGLDSWGDGDAPIDAVVKSSGELSVEANKILYRRYFLAMHQDVFHG